MIPVISFQWSLMFVKTLRLETKSFPCPPEELKYYLKTDSWYPLIPFADKYNQHEQYYFVRCWCLAFLSINSANWKLQILSFHFLMSTTASLLLVWTEWFPCQQLGTLKEIRNGQSVDFINCFNGTKCSTIIVKRRNLISEINTWG